MISPVRRRSARTWKLWLLAALALGVAGGCGKMAAPSADPESLIEDNVRRAVEASSDGNPKAARGHLNSAVNMMVSFGMARTSAHAQVGRELMERGRHADAVDFLDTALKERSMQWDPLVWATLATALARQDNAPRAAQVQREAARRAEEIMAADGGAPAVGAEARPLRRSADRDPAVERLVQAGWYYYDVRDIPRAIEAWRRARDLAPDDHIVLNLLGYTLADKGTTAAEFREALELTRRAVELAPNNFIILDSYGWALYKTGDVKSARRVLRQSVDGAPGYPEIRFHLGVVYAELGLTREAENEFTRALRLKPDYAEAKKAMEALKKNPPVEGVREGR